MNSLRCIENIAGSILKDKIDKYFVSHDIEHSGRVIKFIKDILDGGKCILNEKELYVLFAATCLHDIGMQDELLGGDIEYRRPKHQKLGANRIKKDPSDQNKYGIIPQFCFVVATTIEGHRDVDLTASKEFEPRTIGRELIQVRLLAALLRIADELDITFERINPYRDKLLKMSLPDKMHYYKHYYVQGVKISTGQIKVSFRFPIGKKESYEVLFRNLVLRKIEKCWCEVVDILSENKIPIFLAPDNHHKSWEENVESIPEEVFEYAHKDVVKT